MAHVEYISRFVERWRLFLERFDKRDLEGEAVFHAICGPYVGMDRHYHDLKHIVDGLALLEETREAVPAWFADPIDDAAIEIAFLEHDVVYDAKKSDNEERSALMAVLHADALGFPLEVGQRARRYVLATDHKTLATERGAQIVCDIDLAAPWSEFCMNSADIREEYRFLDADAWRAGRKAFFAKMLDRTYRPTIYQTGYFRARFEEAARANMQRVVDMT